MFLILAIEPDRRQANRLSAIARGPLRNAELVIVDTVDAALDVLARHAPDSGPDLDAALGERRRDAGRAAA